VSEVLHTRVDDGVLEVTLDRPPANAIDLSTSQEMGDVFASFRDDPALRVAIVRTEGDKFFCAGWDLKAAAEGAAVRSDRGPDALPQAARATVAAAIVVRIANRFTGDQSIQVGPRRLH